MEGLFCFSYDKRLPTTRIGRHENWRLPASFLNSTSVSLYSSEEEVFFLLCHTRFSVMKQSCGRWSQPNTMFQWYFSETPSEKSSICSLWGNPYLDFILSKPTKSSVVLLALCYKLNNDGMSSKAWAFVLVLQEAQITVSNCCVMTTAAVFLKNVCVRDFDQA